MVYFSVSTPEATLDQVLAGTVSDSRPVVGSFMSEYDFGTITTIDGSTKTYTTFAGIQGSSYFDALIGALSGRASATIGIDGYFVAGGFVWCGRLRRSALIKDARVATFRLADSANVTQGFAYGDAASPYALTTQLFTERGTPLNGAYLMGDQLRYYHLGYALMAAVPTDYACYDKDYKPLSGNVLSSQGTLAVPTGTKYVVAADSSACVIDGSRVSPLPFGPDYAKLGITTVTSASLSANYAGKSASPSTFVGPWYGSDGKPATGNVGSYYFDLQGFSSYQPATPYSALYASSPTMISVLYAPADVHYARMLTLPPNTNTPFARDLAGNVGVSTVGFGTGIQVRDDGSAILYTKAQPLTVTQNDTSIATYVDNATNPRIALLSDGSYSIGTVAGYRVMYGFEAIIHSTFKLLMWPVIAVFLIVLIAALGFVVIHYFKAKTGAVGV